MPVLRPNTLVQNVLQMLTGGRISLEFSVSSGNHSHSAEDGEPACPNLCCSAIPVQGEEVRTKLLSPAERAPKKKLAPLLRHSPMLHWLHPDAYEYYMSFWNHHFPVMLPIVTETTGWRKPWPSVPPPEWRCFPMTCPQLQQEEICKVTKLSLSTWPGT